MPNEFKLATWTNIAELEQLWIQEREAEVAAKSEVALNEVFTFISSMGLDAMTDEDRAIAAILCIIGNQPSGASAFLSSSATLDHFIMEEPRLENWAGLLVHRKTWRSEMLTVGELPPVQTDFYVQEFWRGNVDVMAAGEAVTKCAAGTMWDSDRNFDAAHLANLFQTCAVLEKWSDEQKVEAYQRTWNLFQWFIAWGSFTEFTAALQALEAEEQ